MKPEKALKKLKIELPEKYANNPTAGVYDLYLANPPKISDDQFMRYLDSVSYVSVFDMFKDFADFCGLSDLTEWVEEKAVVFTYSSASKPLVRMMESAFL